MTVQQVVPAIESVSLEAGLDRIVASPSLQPFSAHVIEFCADFSRAIFKDPEALAYPELQALAFWMRKTELLRLRDTFHASRRADALLVPQGIAFHVPPANVDTIFIYSWLLSVLAGNRNIVRLSHRVSPQTEILCRLFNAVLESAPALRDSTWMLRYGHEREVTEAISARADIRVIWGGDVSVNSIRAIPLPPHARELTFPDRYSFAVVRASRYLDSSAADRQTIAGQFFNDTFWFDQMACSSPRLVCWDGMADGACEASSDFLARLKEHAVRKQYQVRPATRMARFTFACGEALEDHASRHEDFGQFTVLGLDRFEQLTRDHCGGGLLFQYRIGSLDDLVPFVSRRDQTLTYFGFDRAELVEFAARLNGRGIDRIVPIGQALNFNRFWDGNDLLLSFLRYVYIG